MQRMQSVSRTVQYNILNCHVRCFGLTYDYSWNHANAVLRTETALCVRSTDVTHNPILHCTVLMRLIPAFHCLILWDPLCI